MRLNPQKKCRKECARIPEGWEAWFRTMDIWKRCLIFFSTKSLIGSNANLNPQFLHYFKGNLHSACLSLVICLKGVCDNRIQNGKTRRKKYFMSCRGFTAMPRGQQLPITLCYGVPSLNAVKHLFKCLGGFGF